MDDRAPIDPDAQETLDGKPAPPEPADEDPPAEEVLIDQEGETLLSHGADEATAVPETVSPETDDENDSVITRLRTRLGIRGFTRVAFADAGSPEIRGPASSNRYCHLGEIARGGMGAICKIVDNDIGRPVAQKVILGGSDRDRVERFVSEAQVTGQLEHPNIVPVHELGLDEETRRTVTLSKRLEIFLKVCDAVAFAHDRGVIHRDLKPENVMVGEFGEVLVLDWGLARVHMKPDPPDPLSKRPGERESREDRPAFDQGNQYAAKPHQEDQESEDPGNRLTVDGDVLGTPAYMPPEQADGRIGEVDHRSDIFALGGILYRMLTLEPPYAGPTTVNVMMMAVEGDVVPPRKRAPERSIPAELESICLQAMAKDPADRYGAVEAMAEDVRAFLDHRLVSVHPYGLLSRFARLVQRHPAGSVGAAVAAFLLVFSSAVVWILLARAEASAARASEAQARERASRASAREARAHAEAEAARAQVEENRRHEAEAEAAHAERALDKGRLVSIVLRSANAELADVVRALKRHRRRGEEEIEKERQARLEELWRPVERFEATVAPDAASRATWLALKAWLKDCAGKTEEAGRLYAASRQTDADVAQADLMEGMAGFVEYLYLQPFPAYSVSADTFRFHGIPRETGAMKKARKRFETHMARARKARVWGESSAQDFREALLGFQGIHQQDLDKAETGLSKALVLPETAWIREEILFARAKVRLLALRFDGALSDLDKLLTENPDSLIINFFKAKTLCCKGFWEQTRNENPAASLQEAVEAYSRSIEARPRWRSPYHARGLAYSALAQARESAGEDPGPALREAVEDFTTALGMTPPPSVADYNTAVSYNARGTSFHFLASLEVRDGKDAEPLFRKALSDFNAALVSKPNYRTPVQNLVRLYRHFGRWLSQEARSPFAFFQARLDAYRREETGPDAWKACMKQGFLLKFLGRFEEAAGAFERGLTTAGRHERTFTAWRKDARIRASWPAWRIALVRADVAIGLGEAERALEAYQTGLAGADRANASKEETLRPLLQSAYYNFACASSLVYQARSVESGKEAAAPLGRQAVDALRRAFALGWTDLDHVARDPDLDAVRDLEAFRALVEEARDRGK